MPEGDSAKADKYELQLAQAVEHLRGNVKWTLIAFGAIGTTLSRIAAPKLGIFQTELRLWVALFCALGSRRGRLCGSHRARRSLIRAMSN